MRLLALGLLLALSAQSAVAVGNLFFPQSVASGDPRPDSVVLWTRVDDASASGDIPITLKISTEGSPRLIGRSAPLPGADLYDDDVEGAIFAQSAHDHVAKLLVDGLSPDTVYYYQFSYGPFVSPIGRTKTAPAASSTRAVRFAAINCNDYVGRYYNVIQHLCDQELNRIDFVVNLGDYIYETTGDPTFQGGDDSRVMIFSEPDEAIELTASSGLKFYAAQSVGNYRDIYKTIRQDPQLQYLHESFPVISIWDDHEYSDDRWRDVATFFDGKADEMNTQRLRNSEQVWYEFLPTSIGIDGDGVGIAIGPDILYPNTVIFDDYVFGEALKLILTDLRTFRPDHIIPENAYPATIAMTEAETQATFEAAFGAGSFATVRDNFDPYLDIDAAMFSTLKESLLQIIAGQVLPDFAGLSPEFLDGKTPEQLAGEYAAATVQGNLSATYINQLFAGIGQPEPFDAPTMASFQRGVSFYLLGKLSAHTDSGSRYQVVNSIFRLYAGFTYQAFIQSGGAIGRDQDFLGAAQQTFLGTSLATNQSCWPVVAASTPFTPILLELGDVPSGVELPTSGTLNGAIPIEAADLGLTDLIPDLLKTEFLVNADEPIGFPNFHQGIIDLLAANDAVLIDGDIHALIVGELPNSTGDRTVADFTVPSASSGRLLNAFISALRVAEGLFGQGVAEQIGQPFQSFAYDADQFDALIGNIDRVIEHNSPGMVRMNTNTHGYAVFDATTSHLTASFRLIDTRFIIERLYDLSPFARDVLFTELHYRLTKNGAESPVLEEIASVSENDYDRDGDNLTRGQEIAAGTEPDNPDSDGDGVPDDVELELVFMDPNDSSDAASLFPGLYTVDQIRDLRLGNPVVESDGERIIVEFQVEELTDDDGWIDVPGEDGKLMLDLPLENGKRIVRLIFQQDI